MGDFTFGTDENGQVTCPIPKCGAPLYLARTYCIPLVEFDNDEDNGGESVDSVTDSWEVTCEAGHTVDRNTQESDWREPFRLSWLLATGHGQPETCAWCGQPFAIGEAHPHDDEMGYHDGECWTNRYGAGA